MTEFMPPWWPRYGPRSPAPDQQMRVSDSERAQVSDALSRHYSEGRLDQAEFNERMQKAMSAKTRGDLGGLLVDLPPLAVPAPAGRPKRRPGRVLLLFLFTLLIAMTVTSTLWTWHFPWLLAAIVFFVLWRRAHWRWGWGCHAHEHPHSWR